MPAGRIHRCESCYWRSLLSRRLILAEQAFASKQKAEVFERFVVWLADRVGTPKAAFTMNRYLPFFVRYSDMKDVPPSAEQLLEEFSTFGLWQNQLPVHFLDDTEGIKVSAEAKDDEANRQQIKRACASFAEGCAASKLINSYADHLEKKRQEGKSTIRSVRLALTPAKALLEVMLRNGGTLPTQLDLNGYLRAKPGQWAASFGFVVFLREVFRLDLRMPPKRARSAAAKRRLLEAKLIELLRLEERTAKQQEQLVRLGLEYFHHFVRGRLDSVSIAAIGGYWMPDVICPNH